MSTPEREHRDAFIGEIHSIVETMDGKHRDVCTPIPAGWPPSDVLLWHAARCALRMLPRTVADAAEQAERQAFVDLAARAGQAPADPERILALYPPIMDAYRPPVARA